MGEAENRDALERLFGVDGTLLLSPEQEYELRAPDYVMEMPQSGERSAAGTRCARCRRPTPVLPTRRSVGSPAAVTSSSWRRSPTTAIAVCSTCASWSSSRTGRSFARPATTRSHSTHPNGEARSSSRCGARARTRFFAAFSEERLQGGRHHVRRNVVGLTVQDLGLGVGGDVRDRRAVTLIQGKLRRRPSRGSEPSPTRWVNR